MTDEIVAQHPPAIRVGGRRLSVTSRPRPHANLGVPSSGGPIQNENTDYPRPAAHGEEEAHAPPHNEEESPKKKKHGHGGHDDNRLLESAYRRAEATRPTKDNAGGKSGYGAAGRIAQPAGKSLGI